MNDRWANDRPNPCELDSVETTGVFVALEDLGECLTPRLGGADEDHARVLADQSSERLPPITVHRPTGKVIDGLHRVRAAQLRGDRQIRACYVDGTEGDAFVLAVRSNMSHGLPLSLAERRGAAGRIFTLHPEWSDRWVATVVGLSAGTVGQIRRQGPVQIDARVGRDGRARPTNSEQGRRRAAELIEADPKLSLRQVGKAAGISPETVRDVRARIERGESPVPVPGARRRVAAGQCGSDGSDPDQPGPMGISPRVGSARAPELARVTRQLKADPAIRHTETGRLLLRLLDAHAQIDQQMDRILTALPGYCHSAVGDAASACSSLWADVAGEALSRVEPGHAKAS